MNALTRFLRRDPAEVDAWRVEEAIQCTRAGSGQGDKSSFGASPNASATSAPFRSPWNSDRIQVPADADAVAHEERRSGRRDFHAKREGGGVVGGVRGRRRDELAGIHGNGYGEREAGVDVSVGGHGGRIQEALALAVTGRIADRVGEEFDDERRRWRTGEAAGDGRAGAIRHRRGQHGEGLVVVAAADEFDTQARVVAHDHVTADAVAGAGVDPDAVASVEGNGVAGPGYSAADQIVEAVHKNAVHGIAQGVRPGEIGANVVALNQASGR